MALKEIWRIDVKNDKVALADVKKLLESIKAKTGDKRLDKHIARCEAEIRK